MLKSYPLTSPDSLTWREILKGNLHPVHRVIFKYEIQDNDRQ